MKKYEYWGTIVFICFSMLLTLIAIMSFAQKAHADSDFINTTPPLVNQEWKLDHVPAWLDCPLDNVPCVIATIANHYGVDPKLALYVSYKESGWDCSAEGDYSTTTQAYTSFGCWQIHQPEKKGLTKPQAEDLIFSTIWSMKTMVRNGGCKIWSTCPANSV